MVDPFDAFVSPLSASESQGAVEGIAEPSAARPPTELDIRARLARLGRAERDCIELHKALAESLRRLRNARDAVRNVIPQPGGLAIWEMLAYEDLLPVLDRTTREGN